MLELADMKPRCLDLLPQQVRDERSVREGRLWQRFSGVARAGELPAPMSWLSSSSTSAVGPARTKASRASRSGCWCR